ncbi:ergot alkaloid biosynthesis protein [Actinoplanes sp. M2I2]|uniref:ergot alkaloid biosynthesis protein n=1 Tax=Actinoplanes sp. M2I2 TaxID=1734444 RepID=UPI00201FE3C0|nr:ergot alkaloid biosynthesis protein [Actinoplanes sp. M2I2]
MILVLGGTGTTGRLVARKLDDRGQAVRVAARRPPDGGVRFDWHDPATHAPALAGVRAAYVLPPVGVPDPEPVVVPFLQRARDAGVTRAVLLSSSAIPPGETGLGRVHARLGQILPEWAVLRPSWFMENVVGDHPHAVSAREDGEIVSATGDGRVAFIDPDDIAEVAVRALTDPEPHNTDHLLTGPEPLSYAEVAERMTVHWGRPVRHRAVTAGELATRLTAAGLPADFAPFLAGLDVAIAGGAEDRTTDTVERVTGRPPRSLTDFLAARSG